MGSTISTITLHSAKMTTVPSSSIKTDKNTFIIKVDSYDAYTIIDLIRNIADVEISVRNFIIDTIVLDEFIYTNPQDYNAISFVRNNVSILNIYNSEGKITDYSLSVELN